MSSFLFAFCSGGYLVMENWCASSSHRISRLSISPLPVTTT